MDVKCPDLSTCKSTNDVYRFGICCSLDQIQLPPLPQPPQALSNLLQSEDVIGKEFRQHIHQYNASLTFTSLGAKLDETISGGRPYIFKIHGELYHYHGSLLPEDGEIPCYAQLCIFDPSQALGQRQYNNRATLTSTTLNDLQEMMQAFQEEKVISLCGIDEVDQT